MTLYYHRSQLLYGKGDFIQPGNWGRVIQGIGATHNRFYPEYVLESIREREFGGKPSRMQASFVFEKHDKAASFPRVVIQGIKEHIYAVTLDGEPNTHRGNMGWIEAMPKYQTFKGLEECVRRYWREDDRDPDAWEMVVGGVLVVQDRVSSLEENGHAK